MLIQTTKREKILVFGSFKLGKSSLWLDILVKLFESGNTSPTFYAIDTDFAVEKLVEELGFDPVEEGMLELYNPADFSEFMDASVEIRARAGEKDWVIVDMLSYPWEEAQYFYTEGVFGERPDNYFLAMRQEVVAAGGKDARSYGGYEGTDWNFITKIYKQAEIPLTMKGPWNVFAVTEERKMDSREDDPEKTKTYKTVQGYTPVGQKGIGHRFDTVFRMTRRTNGQRELHLVGDRGRMGEGSVWEGMSSNILKIGGPDGDSFVDAYLVEIARWENEIAKPARRVASKPLPKPTATVPKRSVPKRS